MLVWDVIANVWILNGGRLLEIVLFISGTAVGSNLT